MDAFHTGADKPASACESSTFPFREGQHLNDSCQMYSCYSRREAEESRVSEIFQGLLASNKECLIQSTHEGERSQMGGWELLKVTPT